MPNNLYDMLQLQICVCVVCELYLSFLIPNFQATKGRVAKRGFGGKDINH